MFVLARSLAGIPLQQEKGKEFLLTQYCQMPDCMRPHKRVFIELTGASW
jgi:hypothetical protein